MRRFVFLLCLTLALAGCTGGERMTGTGTAVDPYIITTRADLEAVNNDLTAYYELGADIDLAGADWVPLSPDSGDTYFSGSLDGKGHKITNMTIADIGDDSGLFADIDSATIKHLVICNASITTTYGNAGFVFGYASYHSNIRNTISDCKVRGTINASACSQIGGIAGYAKATDLDGCRADLTVAGSGAGAIGGLVGYLYSTSASAVSTADNCEGHLAIQDATATQHFGGCFGWLAGTYLTTIAVNHCVGTIVANIPSGQNVGGVVGYASYAAMMDCKASGSIDGYSFLGGFAGYVGRNCTFTRCSALTDVSAGAGFIGGSEAGTSYPCTCTDCWAGGDAYGAGFWGGSNSKDAAVNCYCFGAVSNAIGGFSAMPAGYQPVTTNCFWDTQTSGVATDATTATGKTTAEMQTQSTFTNWNFSTVWNITSGLYPFLRTAFVTITDGCAVIVHSFPWVGKFQLSRVP